MLSTNREDDEAQCEMSRVTFGLLLQWHTPESLLQGVDIYSQLCDGSDHIVLMIRTYSAMNSVRLTIGYSGSTRSK